MKFVDVLLLVLSFLIVLRWTVGFSDDLDLDKIQNGIELMVMCTTLLYTVPKFIKKLGNGDLKKFVGVLPTIGVLAVMSYKFPEIDPMTLEILAIVLIVVNLLSLRIVKRQIAKKLAKKGQINKEPDKVI